MKLYVHTPESGDWTVVKLDGRQIYEGHSHWNDLLHVVVGAISNIDIEFKEWDDEEFQDEFC